MFHIAINASTRRFAGQPEDGFKCEERVLYYIHILYRAVDHAHDLQRITLL